MGEIQMRLIAGRLRAGEPVSALTDIPGTCCLCPSHLIPSGAVSCASFEKVAADKKLYLRAFKQQLDEQDPISGRAVVQKHGDSLMLQNPPMRPLTTEELDAVFALPFARAVHPVYETAGGVKAIEEVEFSIMHNRGCFGHCNFCSIAVHQGRRVVSRSHDSVVCEAEGVVRSPRYKGYIHDVGGPTANFRFPSCEKQKAAGMCTDRKCLGTSPCPALRVDHCDYLALLRKLRRIPGVKKVFIRSGIRFDYLIADRDDSFLRSWSRTMSRTAQGGARALQRRSAFPDGKAADRRLQPLCPKILPAHHRGRPSAVFGPLSDVFPPRQRLQDAVALALFLKQNNLRPEQVQDFYPTPGTISTCMFHTGYDPLTGEAVYVPRTEAEKRLQRALLQYYKPENRPLVAQALVEAGRADLIGYGPGCLIPPLAADRGPGSGPRAKPVVAQRGKPRFGKNGGRVQGSSPRARQGGARSKAKGFLNPKGRNGK
jgi:radical SAM superfamily enzyme YgiQ (UPF0313 family)